MRADQTGRPWAGLLANLLLGGSITYMNVSQDGATVFGWLSNLASLISLFGWGLICLCHIRLRAAWKAQGRSVNDLPWRSWGYPYCAWWGLCWSILLIVAEFYLAIWPLHETPSAKNFFANFSSVILVVVLYICARIYYRGPWMVSLKEIDLDDGRRFYHDPFDEEKPQGAIAKAKRALTAAFS